MKKSKIEIPLISKEQHKIMIEAISNMQASSQSQTKLSTIMFQKALNGLASIVKDTNQRIMSKNTQQKLFKELNSKYGTKRNKVNRKN
jgi:hypothetical protein